jgi:hypothetical protein
MNIPNAVPGMDEYVYINGTSRLRVYGLCLILLPLGWNVETYLNLKDERTCCTKRIPPTNWCAAVRASIPLWLNALERAFVASEQVQWVVFLSLFQVLFQFFSFYPVCTLV